MTQKDFIALAAVLKAHKPNDSKQYLLWRDIVLGIVRVCETTNPKFHRGKFIAACGIPNILMK